MRTPTKLLVGAAQAVCPANHVIVNSVSQLCANPAGLGSKVVYGSKPEFLFGPIGFVVATN